MVPDDTQEKNLNINGPAQGTIIGDNNEVVNKFYTTNVYNNDNKKKAAHASPLLAPCLPTDHSIVGHRQLLADVKSGLISGKSKSLIMLPGVGKTTLAIELANDKDVLESFPDGVLWVSLGRHPDVLEELKRWAWSLDVDGERLARNRSPPPPSQG